MNDCFKIQPKHRHIRVRRVWHDGTSNTMLLQSAVANLEAIRRADLPAETIYRELLAGRAVDSPHAEFRMIPPAAPLYLGGKP